MPSEKIKIHNLVVVAQQAGDKEYFGFGEAWRKGDQLPLAPMNAVERDDMLLRLERSIACLMDDANKTYQDNYKRDLRSSLDYIVRLSTHEFFFYTQEALTLEEFQVLQNRIAEKAKSLPSGVQLILGSFAVKTADNALINVTPHITCGQQPVFNFIMKNYFSSIDVSYTEVDGAGNYYPLNEFNYKCNGSLMPKIIVNGVNCEFTFKNIVYCKTPGCTPFITAIDICLDHLFGVAKHNLQDIFKNSLALHDRPISYVIVSHGVALREQSCFGCPPVRVDPFDSLKQCLFDTAQIAGLPKKLEFGRELCIMYDVKPTDIHYHKYLKNSYAYKAENQATKRWHFFPAEATHCSLGYSEYHGDELKNQILEYFKRRLQAIDSLYELDDLQKKIVYSTDYQMLATGQGIFTRLFKLKTSSVKVLEEMIATKRSNLSFTSKPK